MILSGKKYDVSEWTYGPWNLVSEENFGNCPNFSPIIENTDHFPDDFIEINFRDSFERIFQEKSEFIQKNNNRESEVISKSCNASSSQPNSTKTQSDKISCSDNMININNKSQIFYIHKKRKSKNEEAIQKDESQKIQNDLNKKQKKLGRKSKKEETEREHSKYSEDNIIQKIKGNVDIFGIDILNKNSNGKFELKKLKNAHKACLKKDININLLKEKLGDILYKEEISTKYKTFKSNENRKIIERIRENKEKNKILINILDLTFEEVLILFRRNINYENDNIKLKEILNKFNGLNFLNDNAEYKDAEYFIDELKKKGHDEKYIEIYKQLCCSYKSWFLKKNGRSSKKKSPK